MKHSSRNISETQIIIFIIIALLSILIVISIYFDQISFYLFNENYKYRGEFIKISVTIFGGILIGLGLRINYLRTISIGKQTENQTKQTENQIKQIKIQGDQILKIAEQNELTRKGQIDERFNNAIEHLGVKSSAIILGGIYTLHRIALEDESYRFTVFNILCSFIRETTSQLDDLEKLPTKNKSNHKPSIVIQTIIDLIFKSYGNVNNIYSLYQADLSNSKLYYADFKGAILNEAIFNNTELQNANFLKAHLKRTKFTNSQLQNANFSNAQLNHISFYNSQLTSAIFTHSNITESNFYNSTMDKINFEYANLTKAALENVIMNYAEVNYSILSNASITRSIIQNTSLYHVVAIKTDFSFSDLSFSEFLFANLTEAKFINSTIKFGSFSGANLMGTNFKTATLTATNFIRGLLQGSSFAGANCIYADLSETHVEAAFLYKANFAGANLSNSHFEGSFSKGKWHEELETNLENRVWKDSEFDQIADHGKISKDEEKKIIEDLRDEFPDEENLEKYIEEIQNQNKNLKPFNQQIITGILTDEMVKKIISEYEDELKSKNSTSNSH